MTSSGCCPRGQRTAHFDWRSAAFAGEKGRVEFAFMCPLAWRTNQTTELLHECTNARWATRVAHGPR